MTLDADVFYPVVRGLFLVTLLLLVGTQAAAWIARRRLGLIAEGPVAEAEGDIGRLVQPLALFLLLLSVARALLQLWSVKDPDEALTLEFSRIVLLDGTWGVSWLTQSVAALLLVIASGGRRGSRRPRWPAMVPLLVVVALVAQSGMGHAASRFWGGPLGRGLDVAHLAAGGIWLGTLGVLAVIVFPRLQDEERLPLLAGVLHDFSLLARVGVSVVVLSGIIVALKYAGSLTAFLAAPWGRLLMAKVAGLAGVMALGWYNWKVVTPAVTHGDPRSATRLRRAARIELTLGLIMLGITAFLVATQLPREG